MGEIERRQPDRLADSEARMADEHFQEKVDEAREEGAPTDVMGEEHVEEFQITVICDYHAATWPEATQEAESITALLAGRDDIFNIRYDIQEKRAP